MLVINIVELTPDLRQLHSSVVEISNNASYYMDLLEDSLNEIISPPRNGVYNKPGIIELSGKQNYLFIGDLHGDYYTLLSVLSTIWTIKNEYLLVFLGDYVDRGYMQVETLALLLILKREYKDQVVLLRGNHEPANWLIPYPHDYPHQLNYKYGKKAGELYEASMRLFNKMPLILIHRGVLLALHGGPPLNVLKTSDWRSAFEADREEFSPSVIEEVLWSDPVEIPEGYLPSPRGAGVLYGRSISLRTFQITSTKLIVRGHEAVNGFKKYHGGTVITVFTSPIVYGFECGGLIKYEFNDKTGGYELNELCVNPG